MRQAARLCQGKSVEIHLRKIKIQTLNHPVRRALTAFFTFLFVIADHGYIRLEILKDRLKEDISFCLTPTRGNRCKTFTANRMYMLYIYHSRHQNILSRTEKRSPFKKRRDGKHAAAHDGKGARVCTQAPILLLPLFLTLFSDCPLRPQRFLLFFTPTGTSAPGSGSRCPC